MIDDERTGIGRQNESDIYDFHKIVKDSSHPYLLLAEGEAESVELSSNNSEK
jgi:hypothetical protein